MQDASATTTDVARGAIVLIESGRVALIERRRAGRVYYLFPGGQTEPGETAEQAAVREALEELGLQVRTERVVAVSDFNGKHQEYFLASCTGGEFGTGPAAELASDAGSPAGSYTPIWMPRDELRHNDVRPRTLADAVAAGLGPTEVLQLHD